VSGVRDREASPTPSALPAGLIGALAVLLLGPLTLLGRAWVGIQIFGMPLGAYLTPLPSILLVSMVLTRRGRERLSSFNRSERRVAVAVAIAVAVGLLRAAGQGLPTLLRFQDMAYLLHLSWVIVGIAAMRMLPTDGHRIRVLRWIAWTFTVTLGLHLLRWASAPAGWAFDRMTGVLGNVSDKPDQLMKDGDLALVSIALSAIAMHLSRRVEAGRAEHALVAISGLLLGAHFAGFTLGGSRGAALGVIVGTALLLRGGAPRAARAALAFCAVFAIVLTLALALATVPEPDTSQPAAPDQTAPLSIAERYEIVAGRRALGATIEQLQVEEGEFIRPSEISWRITIWTEAIGEWRSSARNRSVGIGFGNEIEAMTVPGRQGLDGQNRGVHNIIITVLVRQGAAGILVAAALLFALLSALAGSAPAGIALLTAAIVIAAFDVFLEGVHAPVILWPLIGILICTSQPSPDRLQAA